MVLLLDGFQDKKKSIDNFYRKFDENFPDREKIQHKFESVIDVVNETFPESLQQLNFRRVPLFYTLFSVVAHRLFGLSGEELPIPRKGSITRSERERLADAVKAFSVAIEDARADESVGSDLIPFVTASLRQTDNLRPRQTRFRMLYTSSFLKGALRAASSPRIKYRV